MVPIQVIVKRPGHKAEVQWLVQVYSDSAEVRQYEDGGPPDLLRYDEGVKVYEYNEHMAGLLKRIVKAETEAAILERLRLLYPPLPVIPPDEPDSIVEEIGDDRFVLSDSTELTFQYLERMFLELSTDVVAHALSLEQRPKHRQILGAYRFRAAMAEASEVFRMLADRG